MTELEALRICLDSPKAKSGIAAAQTMDEALEILQNKHAFTPAQCRAFGEQAKLLANDTESAKL